MKTLVLQGASEPQSACFPPHFRVLWTGQRMGVRVSISARPAENAVDIWIRRQSGDRFHTLALERFFTGCQSREYVATVSRGFLENGFSAAD